MFILQFLARLIAVLRSAATPAQIGGGFVLGMAIGFIPSFVIKVILFVILILINVNIATALFAAAVCGLTAFLFDPVFHSLGYFLLTDIGFLRPLYSALYNTPFVPFTGFNNTVVMGSFMVSLFLLVPVYLAVVRGVIRYRERLEPVIGQSKIVKVIQRSTWYKWVVRVWRMGDQFL